MGRYRVAIIGCGRPPRCSGHDGRAAVEIIMAIYESQSRDNAKVTLPLAEPRSALKLLRQAPGW